MLIINNNYEFDVPLSKNNYNSSNINYISPKPKLELMTDKFFGPRSDKNILNPSEVNSNSRSNINSYISLTNKFHSKERSSGKSEDLSGLDSMKFNMKKPTSNSGRINSLY